MSVTVQIQSVLFNKQKTALVRTLENLQNAMRVDGETNQCVRDAVLIWGDASPAALFSEEEITELNSTFDRLSLRYEFFNENTGTAELFRGIPKIPTKRRFAPIAARKFRFIRFFARAADTT